MATPTPLTQTADVINRIIAQAAQLHTIKAAIDDMSGQWTNISAATKLASFPTAALTATGDLGTADSPNPVETNPIDTRGALAGSLVTRTISPNDIAGLLTVLQGVSTILNGGSLAANGTTVQLIAKTL